MIVPMKKVTILISAQDRALGLKKLRRAGVIHIKHIQSPQCEEIDLLDQQVSETEQASNILDTQDVDVKKQSQKKKADVITQEILGLNTEIKSLKTQLQEKLETYRWFETWGDVSPSSVNTLRENGIHIRFYIGNASGLKKLPETKKIQIVKENGSLVYFTLFSESEDDKLNFKEESLPDSEPDDLRRAIAGLETKIAKTSVKLQSMVIYSDTLRTHVQVLKKKLEMSEALHGMGDAEGFVYLRGFCPEDAVLELKKNADQSGWGYIIQDPDDPSEVPTLLKNSKIPRMIEPLFHFMGILPGYHELDVSFIFLLFFSVFYAMIIGDAGYGFVFLGLTAFFRLKFRRAPVEPFALFFVLSISTIIWGALTGTWFGSRALANWPPIHQIIIRPMFSFNESKEATKFMMRFSFFLGLIHLMLAHFMAFLKKRPAIKAVAEWGWILICAGMFFVVDLLVLSNPLPDLAVILIITGLMLVGIFTNFQKHPLKMIGSFIGSILNSIQSIISAFSDIVSYIRLFAVGLAGVTVAASFNDMAGGVLAPIILVLGHGLNIILGMMSVMVHGVRLNMLEFSGHLGQEWTGSPYKPFKE